MRLDHRVGTCSICRVKPSTVGNLPKSLCKSRINQSIQIHQQISVFQTANIDYYIHHHFHSSVWNSGHPASSRTTRQSWPPGVPTAWLLDLRCYRRWWCLSRSLYVAIASQHIKRSLAFEDESTRWWQKWDWNDDVYFLWSCIPDCKTWSFKFESLIVIVGVVRHFHSQWNTQTR